MALCNKPSKHSNALTNYYIRLRADYLIAAEKNAMPAELASDIENLLNTPQKTWKEAYEIEQRLTCYYDEAALDIELHAKLSEYKNRIGDGTHNAMTEEVLDVSTMDLAAKRAYLLRIIRKLQWYYTNRETRREYMYLIRRRTSSVFLCSFGTFCLSLLVAVVLCVASDCTILQENSSLQRLNTFHVSAAVLIIGMCAGLLGASFSMLISMKHNIGDCTIQDLRFRHRIGYLLFRPVIGVGAALILFFLMQSELPSSLGLLNLDSVLPNFNEIRGHNGQDIRELYRDISLIIVWSFIAGFSEKFIPHFLAKTESQLTEPGTRGRRPLLKGH